MKKGTIGLLVVGLIVLIGFFSFKGLYNGIVTAEEASIAQWSNVEIAYQRRADLIPNLVKTVKAAADYEKETLTAVVEARAKATSINVNANDLSTENLKKFQAAQDQLSGALSRLLLTVERYPDLKANQNYAAFMSQLEGTENRISVERRKFTGEVANYNKKIKRFPGNIVASMFGFERIDFFTAEKGAEKAPEADF